MQINPLWLEHDGARLFAAECGTGAVVVLLHGGMADHRVCLPHMESLSRSFRVIAPDQRGSGRSWCGEALSFARLTDDLLAWMDMLQQERAVIVGASSATGIAVHFALANPGRVAGLALLQPVYAGAGQGLTPEQAGMFQWMDGIASRVLEDGMPAIAPLYANVPEPFREQAIAAAMEFDAASIVATSHFLASGEQPFRSGADLAHISAPVLLQRGADPMHPAAVSDLYLQHLAHVQVLEAQEPLLAEKLAEFCAV